MIISHRHRFIFVKTVKTAGTSVEVFLSRHCGAEDVLTPITPPVEPHRARNEAGFYHHMPAHAIRERVGAEVWDGYFKFCIERNPWDKALSHFYMRRAREREGMTFEAYIAAGKFPADYRKYTEPGEAEKIIVDRVVRYERLVEELAEVFGRLGIPFGGSLGVNAKAEYRTDRRHYREVFTAEQAAVIEEAFRHEIAMHGYRF